MKLKKNELKIFYKEKLNTELDQALEDALKKFGYEIRALGLNTNNIRDLTFDKGLDLES